MNTENDPKSPEPDDILESDEWLDGYLEKEGQNHLLIERLEGKLTKERQERRSERFVSFVIVLILFNIMIFTVLPTFGAAISILFLEIIVLMYAADKLNQKWFYKFMDKFSGLIGPK